MGHERSSMAGVGSHDVVNIPASTFNAYTLMGQDGPEYVSAISYAHSDHIHMDLSPLPPLYLSQLSSYCAIDIRG